MALIIGEGEENDPNALSLTTRKGTPIPNVRRPERPSESRKAAVDTWANIHPRAMLRSITSVYNCMGMVFAARRTCIDTEHSELILEEDDYRRLSGLSELQRGDVVVYKRNQFQRATHVGIVSQIIPQITSASWEIYIMSKWGEDGEYIHLMEDVPIIYGEPAEYWTDRRQYNDTD